MRPISSQATDAFAASVDLIAPYLSQVEEKLRQQASCFVPGVDHYIAYACGGTGKRLRPVLALLAGGATGAILSEHLDLAVILELVHIASLVHDDIMDGADLRRERPTLNAKWGNSLSVLVGDVLFAHALKMATNFSKIELCRRIADAASNVCSGEILQTEHRFDLNLSLPDYYRMVEMKTGSLFSTACELGARLNESTSEVIESLKNYGNKIGIAYQILDDCIDLVGNEEKVGKTLGTDLLGGKFTLPILMLLQTSPKKEKEELHQLLLNKQGIDAVSLISRTMAQGAFTSSVKEAERLIEEAEYELSSLSENSYVTGLRGLATYLRGMLQTVSGR
ncbi:MAG: farnesyltranstransferase [Verrucomicrobia bacterium RIFCSPHIGHO2_12_FULL_41_10]|nr:MAG: farnesyltranstransferase [Verrucomicrobia bacterium RIFCSPHIGHO2_12_FULL_41_10]